MSKYTNQLTDTDFENIFEEIVLLKEKDGKTYRIDYDIVCNNRKIKRNDKSAYLTLFIRDFSCSMAHANSTLKRNVELKYIDYMLRRFEGTNYEAELREANSKKNLSTTEL